MILWWLSLQRVAVAAYRLMERILRENPMAELTSERLEPSAAVGATVSDEDVLDWVTEQGTTIYHPVGTCQMIAEHRNKDGRS